MRQLVEQFCRPFVAGKPFLYAGHALTTSTPGVLLLGRCLGWRKPDHADRTDRGDAGRLYALQRPESNQPQLQPVLHEQLGYTPDAHLRHTALSAPKFTARLNEVLPQTVGQEWSDSTTDSLYPLRDLASEPPSRGPITMVPCTGL